MEQKKHYLVYKTTCLVNGKIYIGQHQTYNPNDNYLGSGRELKSDIHKLGRENFKREILFDFDTFKEMDDKEKELVTEEFVARADTYNVRLGGQNPEVDRICTMGREKRRQLLEEDPEWANIYRKNLSESRKRLWREHPEKFVNCCAGRFPQAFLGHHHSEETKQKMCEKAKLRTGERNSSFGTIWIYNESLKENKKVKKELVGDFLKEGWIVGRCMEFYHKK